MRDLLGEDWAILDEDIERGATVADLLGHRTGMPRHDYSGTTRKGNVKEMVSVLSRLKCVSNQKWTRSSRSRRSGTSAQARRSVKPSSTTI
jgi:hypothetical protein